MKPTVRLRWMLYGVAAVALALSAWRLISERGDPALFWGRLARHGGDAGQRHVAVDALAAEGGRRAAPGLVLALEDEDEEVRLAAVKGLRRLFAPERWPPAPNPEGAPREVIAALEDRALRDPAATVRTRAIDALAAPGLGDPAGPKAQALFRAKFEDMQEDAEVRGRAFEALEGDWDRPEVAARYCTDPAPAVRRAAMKKLAAARRLAMPKAGLKRGDWPEGPYCEAVAKALADRDPGVRYEGLIALPTRRDLATEPWRRLLPGVIAAIDDRDPRARFVACHFAPMLTTGPGDVREVAEALKGRLDDPDFLTRATAINALASFEADAMLLLPLMIEAHAADPRRHDASPDPGGERQHRWRVGVVAGGWLAAHPPAR
jgi:HEAT repeat protein